MGGSRKERTGSEGGERERTASSGNQKGAKKGDKMG